MQKIVTHTSCAEHAIARWSLNKIRAGVLGVLLCMLCGLNGCASPAVIAAAAATAGFTLAQGQAEAYINGRLKAARMVSLQQGYEAALAMAHDLQLDVQEQWINSTEAYVKAKAANGPTIKVTMQAKSPMITKFIIRVGLMGDQSVSTLVFWRIDTHLPASARMPASPIAVPMSQPNETAPATTQSEQ